MATTPLPFPQESTGSVGPAAPLPPGTAVGHLTIERVLHEGLHAVVYLARDPTGEALALMEYFPRALALRQPDGSVRARQAGDAIALSVGREAFVLEANTLERIEHPGLVRVRGSLQAHRTVYRAMTYIDGPTLERHIGAHGGAASAGAVVRLLDQLLDALDALHRAGVVHGCVRPDQILMAAGERPVLLGMGSAGAEIAGHEAGPWSAPEQASMSRHDRITTATDLYMVAATAWCYATGDAPPALRDRLANPDAWDPAADLADLPEAESDTPGMQAALSSALRAALALRPSARPQHVADLRRLLHPGASPAPFETSGAAPLWVGAMPDRDAQWEVFEKEGYYGRRSQGPADPDASERSISATDVRVRQPSIDAIDTPTQDEGQAASRGSRWPWVVSLSILSGLAVAAWWVLNEEAATQLPRAAVDRLPPVVDVAASPPTVAAPSASVPAGAIPATAAEPTPPAATTASAPPMSTAGSAPAAAPAPAVSERPVTPSAPVAAATRPPAPAPAVPAAARPRPTAPLSPRAACGNRSQFALLYCLQEQCSKPSLRNHAQCRELRRAGDIQ